MSKSKVSKSKTVKNPCVVCGGSSECLECKGTGAGDSSLDPDDPKWWYCETCQGSGMCVTCHPKWAKA